MWITFFFAAAAVLVALYVPGALALRAARLRLLDALCLAPLVSLFLYAFGSTVFAASSIPASWWSLLVSAGALGFGVGIASSLLCRVGKRGVGSHGKVGGHHYGVPSRRVSDAVSWGIAVPYVLIGLAVVTFFFVRNLDSPASMLQEIDNIHHLGTVKAFVETRDYSSFGSTLYATSADKAIAPFTSTLGFYPSLWHCVAAMVVDATGASVPLVANALNTMLAGFVFPLSMFAFLARILPSKPLMMVCGAVMASAFGPFPWGFLLFGPIYPNLLGYAILPLALVVFIQLVKRGCGAKERLGWVAMLLMSLVALLFSQPNAVFAAVVILGPYCVQIASQRIALLPFAWAKKRPASLIAGAVVLCGIAMVWYALHNSSFMADVVAFNWVANFSRTQAVTNVLLMSYTYLTRFQPVFATAIFVGIAYTFGKRRHLWLTFAYLLANLIYVVAVSSEGTWKHILAGFWYTDPIRLSATVVFAAVPLAAIGLCVLARAVRGLVEMLSGRAGGEFDSRVVTPAFLLVVSMVTYYPNFAIPYQGGVSTAFGTIQEYAKSQNSKETINVLDGDEQDFARRALELVPEGALILNSPHDGSAFLYPSEGANVYYRYISGYGGDDETEASVAIRERLDEIDEDEEVRQAVDSVQAHYVLLLDKGGEIEEGRRYLWGYWEDQWEGFNAIDDDTPGFEVLLAEGDMRLYKIEDAA